MKKYLLYILLTISSLTYAYDWDQCSLSGGVDVVTNYNWRGFNVGGVSAQPWVEFSTHGLSIEAWSSLGSGTHDDFNQFIPELDLSLSYTTMDNHVTIGLNHYYYFDGPFFAFSRNLNKLGSSQTEFELNFYIHDEYPLELGVDVMFGGDFYSANGYLITTNENVADLLFSTYIYLRYTFEIDNIEIIPEFGFSPNSSMYTYYDYETNTHLSFAINNISCKINYTFWETDYTSMYITGDVFFNLFDVGYEIFEYGKNACINVGIGIEL